MINTNQVIKNQLSQHKEKEWRNAIEQERFDIEGNCFLCGRQQYLHCIPSIKKCKNDFTSITNG